MFANVNIAVVNFSVPDVCTTLAGPAPLVNIAISCSHIPAVFNVIVGGGLAENLLLTGTVSSGDEAGTGLGVVVPSVKGPDRPILGSVKVFIGTAPATRLTSPGIQNASNCLGFSASPSQFQVMILT